MTVGKQPCERVVAEILPVIRAKVASIIIEEYGLSQTKTAELLGVTQAAISQYATGRRADERALEHLPKVDSEFEKMASRLVEGLDGKERKIIICRICGMCQEESEI
ncbi:MAG: helix-turn-helix domain-containing protein [Thermoplasmata archaeon]|nr:helix-turn-helix domain-containing protein [Candidatus Thermoplasmatota archaeon]MCK4948534.1 helix-turn-helix domain-containing protein [Thermoplasmata archaeon]